MFSVANHKIVRNKLTINYYCSPVYLTFWLIDIIDQQKPDKEQGHGGDDQTGNYLLYIMACVEAYTGIVFKLF